MNRRFRLETVERLRATGLEQAGAALADAADARSAAIRLRESLTQALLAPLDVGADDPAELAGRAAQRERLRELRAEAAATVDVRDGELAAARQAWLTARAQLRAVQSLHDTHRQALAAADARRDQRAADEVAGIAASRRALAADRDARHRARARAGQHDEEGAA